VATLARWCYQHRWIVLVGWLVALVGTGAVSSAAGTDFRDSFSLPGTESQAAIDILERDFPAQSGDAATIVLHARVGVLTDSALQQPAVAMLEQVAGLPHVAELGSPFTPEGAGQISADGRTAFASVAFDGIGSDLPRDAIVEVMDTAQAADQGALQVELTGSAIMNGEAAAISYTEIVGIAAAAIVLFIAFGSLLAMTLPLITAILAVATGTSLIALLSHLGNIAEFSTLLSTLIGLGVGIDYALFIVNRHRIALRAGKTPQQAVVIALSTSGRAVMFAGVTVCIALLGMFALGVSFLYGIAISAALTVALTMISAVTLLPALLGFYGMKALNKKERRRLAESGPEQDVAAGFWFRWARGIERRPKLVSVFALALIAVLAIPFFSLRLGSSDQGNGAETKTSKRGYDLLAEGFGPGFNGPFMLVAETPDAGAVATFNTVLDAIAETPGVASVTPARPSPNGAATIATFYPTTSPQDAETADLLDRLRDDVVPQARAGAPTAVYVGGITAVFEDFSSVLQDKLPLFIGVVVVLAFLLLVLLFRSFVIPLTASVMNLLAVGAAFGVIVSVFQWGWLSSVFGVSGGPVEPFVPVLLFAILFGLSMDYEVFLVSRMHEEWTARRDNRAAVTLGQGETGRVVIAAGAIMSLVFASFILGDERVIKLFGLGLAVAIAIDAFFIRMVLVPALMHVFGKANWWLPGWLDRVLPRVSVEAGDGEDGRDHPVPPDVDLKKGSVGPAVPGQPGKDRRRAEEPTPR
jgi:putative drug exporter of the RND superfamily